MSTHSAQPPKLKLAALPHGRTQRGRGGQAHLNLQKPPGKGKPGTIGKEHPQESPCPRLAASRILRECGQRLLVWAETERRARGRGYRRVLPLIRSQHCDGRPSRTRRAARTSIPRTSTPGHAGSRADRRPASPGRHRTPSRASSPATYRRHQERRCRHLERILKRCTVGRH